MGPLTLHRVQEMEDLEERLIEYQSIQKEIESQVHVISAVFKLCDHLESHCFNETLPSLHDNNSNEGDCSNGNGKMSASRSRCALLRSEALMMENRWHKVWLLALEWQCCLEERLSSKVVKEFCFPLPYLGNMVQTPGCWSKVDPKNPVRATTTPLSTLAKEADEDPRAAAAEVLPETVHISVRSENICRFLSKNFICMENPETESGVIKDNKEELILCSQCKWSIKGFVFDADSNDNIKGEGSISLSPSHSSNWDFCRDQDGDRFLSLSRDAALNVTARLLTEMHNQSLSGINFLLLTIEDSLEVGIKYYKNKNSDNSNMFSGACCHKLNLDGFSKEPKLKEKLHKIMECYSIQWMRDSQDIVEAKLASLRKVFYIRVHQLDKLLLLWTVANEIQEVAFGVESLRQFGRMLGWKAMMRKKVDEVTNGNVGAQTIMDGVSEPVSQLERNALIEENERILSKKAIALEKDIHAVDWSSWQIEIVAMQSSIENLSLRFNALKQEVNYLTKGEWIDSNEMVGWMVVGSDQSKVEADDLANARVAKGTGSQSTCRRLRKCSKYVFVIFLVLKLLLGLASIVSPNCCFMRNNLKWSLQPQLRYFDGPPPQ